MKKIGTKTIKTKRLVLRQFTESDAQEIFDGFVNEEDFLYYANKKKRTIQEEIDSLKEIKEKYNNLEYYNWLITLDNKAIGAIHLNVDNYNESVEVNYAIDNRHKGNGYMTEALEAVKHYCLNKLNANRIYGGCEINNIASKRVMEKCKMVYEGIRKDEIYYHDKYHDLDYYYILNDEV